MPEGGRSALSDRITAAILAWIAEHGPATAAEVARACGMEEAIVRRRLVILEWHGFVSAESNGAPRPRWVYTITAESRRRADLNDPRRVLPRQSG